MWLRRFACAALAWVAAPILAEPASVAPDEIALLCKRIDRKLSSVALDECLAADLRVNGGCSAQTAALAYRDFVLER